jgi:hypothetical protein
MQRARRQRLSVSMSFALAGLGAGLGLWSACSSSPTSPQAGNGQSSGGSSGDHVSGAGGGGSGAPGGSGGTPMTDVPGTGGASGSGGGAGGSTPPMTDAATTPTNDGGALGTGGSGGAAGNGDALPPPPSGSDQDQVPDRPLNVDNKMPQLYMIRWKPTDLDPASTGKDEEQTALVDTSKTMQKKLVIVLAGSNGAPGPAGVTSYVAGLGFHAYAIAYHDEYDASTFRPPNADVFGNSRFNELDGMGRKPSQVTVPRPESIEARMAKALPYLQMKNPQGDWAYYLQKNGEIRWSDVIFIGHSHGATSSAAYAKLHRVWRAISLSGPRDTNPVIATWLTMPSATPIDRYYGFTGTQDAQHPDHIKAMEAAGYVGTLTPVEGAQVPFGNSHRLQYTGGHGDSANCNNFAAVCKYMLGVQ